jgi:hypothetical protein
MREKELEEERERKKEKGCITLDGSAVGCATTFVAKDH